MITGGGYHRFIGNSGILHGLIHHVIEDLAAEYLGDGTFDGVFLENLHGVRGLAGVRADRLHRLVDQAGRPVDDGFEGEGADGHFRELGAYQTEVADGVPEGSALLGVMRGGFQFVLGGAQTGSAQRKASHVENIEGDDMATADFVQQIFAGHAAVLERKWAWWSCRANPSSFPRRRE